MATPTHVPAMASRLINAMYAGVRRVSLEGTIGAGKSRFLGCLQERLAKNHAVTVAVVDEPVSAWCETTDDQGKSVLSYFYEDTARYSFLFQINALMTRYSATAEANDDMRHLMCDSRADIPSADGNPRSHVLLSERTVVTDREVFAKMLHSDGKMNGIEYCVYKKTYDTLAARRPECVDVDGVIYIHTSPVEAKERITHRNRPGEDLPVEYLEECEQAHRNWLSAADFPVLVVDGSVHADHAHYDELVELAEGFLVNDLHTRVWRPVTTNDWSAALVRAQSDGVAIYERNLPSLLGQEVQAIPQQVPVAADVHEAVRGIPEYVAE
jgi:deoxyadenosine/deoxycytidine kinase